LEFSSSTSSVIFLIFLSFLAIVFIKSSLLQSSDCAFLTFFFFLKQQHPQHKQPRTVSKIRMTKFNLEMKFHQLSLLIISLIAITHCELNDNESKTSPTKKDEVVPADTITTDDQSVIIPENADLIDNDYHHEHNGDEEYHYHGDKDKHLHKKFH